jgi:energy-coupling factor transporter transmembrane protein EcfT
MIRRQTVYGAVREALMYSMEIKQPAFSYRAGHTFLHKTPAQVKLFALLCFSLTLAAAGGLSSIIIKSAVYIGFTLLFVGFGAVLRIRPHELLRGSMPVLILCAPVIIIRGTTLFPFAIAPAGIIHGLFFCLSILLSFCAGTLYFSCTTMYQLKKSFPPCSGLCLSLTLHFIPRFWTIWEDTRAAYTQRGGVGGIHEFWRLLPAAVERMIEKAAETADALRARGE